MRPRAASFVVVASVALVVTLVAPAASADLRDLGARANDQWKASGAAVAAVPTRFIYDSETIAISLPPLAAQRCTTVALIGARGLSFHAKFGGATDAQEEEEGPPDAAKARGASVAGLLELSHCDAAKSPNAALNRDRLIITSDAGRGAIEVVVARSKAVLPPLRTIFPERTGGLIPASPEPGILPPLPAQNRRADGAEARAKNEGGTVLPRQSWRAAEDGSGAGEIELDPGCHRLEIFGTDPRTANSARKFRLDIDAELRDADEDVILARDRTEAPDGHLEACVGGTTLGGVAFAGAVPGGNVIVTHSSWAIPSHLPLLWGSGPKAKMAAAILARSVIPPRDEPIFVAQGSAGLTPIVVSVEPGACYLVVVGVAHGNPRGLGVRAIVGSVEASDDRGVNDDSGAVAFCARDHDHARLEVDARGTSIAWGLGLYRVQTGLWEIGR